MPKQKTKSSVSKRIKARKSGKVRRSQAKTSHLFSNKTQKQKRKLRKQTNMSPSDVKRYKDII